MAAQRSIVICGGAFAGLALALAFRQGLGAQIPVVVADPALAVRPSRDPRATAIVAACRRLFEALGVWDQVAADSQAILDMVVTDSNWRTPPVRCLHDVCGGCPTWRTFAHMVETAALSMRWSLAPGQEGVDLRATSGFKLNSRPDGVTRDARRW
jgi:2-octaprenyl-6-methoxyphenol hydroxylase